jgi:hypothetical protein
MYAVNKWRMFMWEDAYTTSACDVVLFGISLSNEKWEL